MTLKRLRRRAAYARAAAGIGDRIQAAAEPAPTAQQRLDALTKVDGIIIGGLRDRLRSAEDHERSTLQALVKGELRIFGKPVKVEWPDGRPFGMTDEQIAKML